MEDGVRVRAGAGDGAEAGAGSAEREVLEQAVLQDLLGSQSLLWIG